MIAKSVGSGGKNDFNDVLIVQSLLTVWRGRNKMQPIAIDGAVGKETIGAITAYQKFKKFSVDGRVDAGGRTIKGLTNELGELAVFAPTLAELENVSDTLSSASTVSRSDKSASIFDSAKDTIGSLSGFGDVSRGVKTKSLTANLVVSPKVLGFTGVEEAAAGGTAALAALFAITAILILSPTVRDAVNVRARELDRLLQLAGISMQIKLVDALNLIVSIGNDTIDEANRCRRSPTFESGPECEEAIKNFQNIVRRLRTDLLSDAVAVGLGLFLKTTRNSSDARSIRFELQKILRRLEANIVNLQVALANMQDKCKCQL